MHSIPVISRTQSGTAVTGPVWVGTNQTVSIWCSAESNDTFGKLLGHQWRFSNYSRIMPGVGKGSISDDDVYMERYAGNISVQVSTWKRVLHFRSIQPSLAGMYLCVANYNHTFYNQSVEIHVTSE